MQNILEQPRIERLAGIVNGLAPSTAGERGGADGDREEIEP
jgi:hypothetical protein